MMMVIVLSTTDIWSGPPMWLLFFYHLLGLLLFTHQLHRDTPAGLQRSPMSFVLALKQGWLLRCLTLVSPWVQPQELELWKFINWKKLHRVPLIAHCAWWSADEVCIKSDLILCETKINPSQLLFLDFIHAWTYNFVRTLGCVCYHEGDFVYVQIILNAKSVPC